MTEQEKKELQERVKSVIERVNNAAVQAGRDPSEITLVAATKMNDAERVQAAIEAGIRVCGENRVQELQEKYEQNAYDGADLQFIGTLQTNKVKYLIGKVSLIQSMAGLSAKVAKADGQVSENEIRAFKKIFDITAGSNDKLARIFNEAKQTADNFEPYAFQLRLLAKDDLNLQESIVENLFKIAVADGRFGDAELGIIRSVATIIELPDGNFEAIRQNFEIRTQASSLNDCYQVLGVFCNASNCEIKRRWKELINQYHPDRAQANGADRGTIEAYTLKMAEINNAYQNIMKSRKTI